MNRIFVLLIWVSVMACNKENTPADTVCFTLSERQCAMDPYQAYIPDGKTTADKLKGIQLYLKAQDINEVKVASNPPYTGAVCLACICPSGISYQLTIAAVDSNKLKALDLLVAATSCE